ncbi:hypothetical protein Pmar_PMAR005738, partial [Perkinsus marinus ATCC 50983]
MAKRLRSEAALRRRKAKERTRRALLRAKTPKAFKPSGRASVLSITSPLGKETPFGPHKSVDHLADRRAIDLYKTAFALAESEQVELLEKISDGTAKSSKCDWGNLKGSAAHQLEPPHQLVEIRNMFDRATNEILSTRAGDSLLKWMQLDREEQGKQQHVWDELGPTLATAATSLRENLCDLLHVSESSIQDCDFQAGLLKAMLLATADIDESED